jgi:predicted NUDIX family NTP pyrophosphohydrolase
MPKESAGLLLFRRRAGQVEVLLVHPGGPFFAKKDLGAWSIPKGELAEGEEPLAGARREVAEETGLNPDGPFLSLGAVRQSAAKTVHAWAAEADCDPAAIKANTFELEWPPRSGKRQHFPEIDRAGWFSLSAAREKMLAGQIPLLDRLAAALPST